MSERRFRRVSSVGAGLGILVMVSAAGALGGCASKGPVDLGSGNLEDIELAKEISIHEVEATVKPEGIDARRDIVVRRIDVDELSMGHARMQQTYRGVEVWGGEAIVHLNRDGSVFTVTDNLIRNVGRDRSATGLDVTPRFDQIDAIDRVLGDYDCVSCLTDDPEADLLVVRHGREDRLAYRVALRREDGTERTSMPVIFIDAHTGEKLFEYDNLQTDTGASLYSGSVTIATSVSGSTRYLEDTVKKIGTFNNNNTPSTNTGAGTTSRMTDPDGTWNSSIQKAAVDAHYGATKVYDYFKDIHGRNGINGSGGPAPYTAATNASIGLISSKVHYGKSFVNAYWNGQFMTYGDGDGVTSNALVTLDIAGHEMTHGIVQFTANLQYLNESGALNEGFADIFGAMVERFTRGETMATWKIGEDAWTPQVAGDALRYMDNPHQAQNGGFTADDDPCHYSERYAGSLDDGGVHINSGIVNKWFYLLAKGGAHHLGGSMVGIGPDDAAKIAYKALTGYMTSTTNFCGARVATINAATALYGAADARVTAVGKAWDLVGRTAANCAAAPPPPSCNVCAPISTPLAKGCSSCATTVCNSDPFCCNTKWDQTCVNEANAWCSPDPCP